MMIWKWQMGKSLFEKLWHDLE